jgi:hypothetical protein
MFKKEALMVAMAVAGLAVLPRAAVAQGAWCSEDMNARNCGFYTLEQCRAAASGLGAGCYANQFVTRTAAPQPVRRKRTKHRH